jgi:hypothetical protein
VYVKGVGVGRGVSAETKPSGVCTVSNTEGGLCVEVANGTKSAAVGIGRDSGEVQAVKEKKEARRRKMKSMRCMRRL